MERTLAIIKPDALQRQAVGAILRKIEDAGFKICAMRLVYLSQREAQRFYSVHSKQSFFESLTKFMSEGPVIVLALEAPNAIHQWRNLMGSTDPSKAKPGTIRHEFGSSIERNAVHGSDAPETATFELSFFFRKLDFVDS